MNRLPRVVEEHVGCVPGVTNRIPGMGAFPESKRSNTEKFWFTSGPQLGVPVGGILRPILGVTCPSAAALNADIAIASAASFRCDFTIELNVLCVRIKAANKPTILFGWEGTI